MSSTGCSSRSSVLVVHRGRVSSAAKLNNAAWLVKIPSRPLLRQSCLICQFPSLSRVTFFIVAYFFLYHHYHHLSCGSAANRHCSMVSLLHCFAIKGFLINRFLVIIGIILIMLMIIKIPMLANAKVVGFLSSHSLFNT